MFMDIIYLDPGESHFKHEQHFTPPPQPTLHVVWGGKCYITPMISAQTLVGRCFTAGTHKKDCEMNKKLVIYFGRSVKCITFSIQLYQYIIVFRR